MKIISGLLERYVFVLAVSFFLIILGAGSFLAMPRSLFPELKYPRVVVEVGMGFTPLNVMEWNVTAILERELRAVPGVRVVHSSTSRGLSVIDVFLQENQDITLAVQRVSSKIGEARGLVPSNAEITVRPVTADAFPAAEYCFTSRKKESRELRTFIEYTLKPQLMVIPGVFDVKVLGGDLPEFSVELDSKKLAARNLTVADVNDRIKGTNSIDFLGPIESDEAQLLAFGGRFLTTEKEIGSVVVDSALGRGTRIFDLGTVKKSNAYKTKDISLNGRECVAVDVFYQVGTDQNKISRAVLSKIDEIVKVEQDLYYKGWDLNEFTDMAIGAVLIDLVVGMLIIALVMLMFLHSPQKSAIALISIPVSAAFTFLAMSQMGLSINLMTLGGLIAAVGLVVDNAVIVLEMFQVQSEMPGATVTSALIETLRKVIRPLLFGTFTIVMVFAPISYLSGISGMFFSPMAFVHGLSLSLSVIIALAIVPSSILLFFGKGKMKAVKDRNEFNEGRVAKVYTLVLKLFLRIPKSIFILLLITHLSAFGIFHFAKTGFLPEWDEGDVVVDFRAITPIGLKQTVRQVKAVEKYISNIPEVDFFIRKVGTGIAEFNHPPYQGEFIIKLRKERSRSVFEIRDEISAKLESNVDGFEFDLFQILPDRMSDLTGSAKPIVIFLRGKEEREIKSAAAQIKDELSKLEGLDSVRVEEPEMAIERFFIADQNVSRAIDVNPSALNEGIRFALFSVDSTVVQVGSQSIPIRIRSSNQASTEDAKAFQHLAVFTNKGGLQKISQLGSVSDTENRIEATHIDGIPVKVLTAELSGRDLGSVVPDIKRLLGKYPAKGVFPELGGDYALQKKSFVELLLAFCAGLTFIFLTSLAFSNRLSVAIPILASSLVPPALGLVGCVICGVNLDISSFSGLISVTGISVANSFMAISAIEGLPNFKESRTDAIEKGMLSRLRPILMTNLAAMAGFVPIAAGLFSGDEILRPFAIAIIFGLIGAIYTTLFLMPSLYFQFSQNPIMSLPSHLGPFNNHANLTF